MRWIAAVVLCALVAARPDSASSQALDNPVLGEAEALVRTGRAEEAWLLLAAFEREYAGRPDFDYLLGLAALESGRPNRATFVLERVITTNPGHLAARLEMARAYFALSDYERAEREFGLLLASAPSEEIRSLSRAYLERIRGATQRRQSGFSGYVEAAFGRDTNVSAAAAQSSIFVPALGVELAPDPAFRRRPDEFISLAAGLEYAHAIRPGLGLVLGADLRERWHQDAEAFDSRSVDVNALLNHRLDEREAMQYSVGTDHYDLDDRRYRDTQSLGVEWSRNDGPTRVALGGQGHRIRYRALEARDSSSDLVAASASASHLLQPSTDTRIFFGLYLGYDDAVAGRADGDRRIFGASLGVQRRLMSRVHGFVRLSWLDSDYKTENPDFMAVRRDRQVDAAAGVGWQFTYGWVLRAQVVHTDNHSNLPPNDYHRTESSVALQRIWD